MERMKAIKKNRKLHKKFYRAMGGFLITLVLLCAAGGNLFAKYYAGQKNKGVGVASSLYFSSNVLKNVASTEDTKDYPMIFNKEAWDGTGECEIEVDIRNFANQLLYNDENLNITYEIKFSLTDLSSDGTTYTVSDTSGTNTESKSITGDATACTFNKVLNGGKPDQHPFKIKVQRPDTASGSTDYTSAKIKVVAKPVSPSYVQKSYTLGGIVCATSITAGYSFTAGFDSGVTIEDYAGYPYTISYTPDIDQKPHTIRISWNTKQVEMDKFNSYYPSDGGTTDSEQNWKYIELIMEPYSTIHLTFYRAATFSTDNLSNCVNVTDLAYQAGGSGN